MYWSQFTFWWQKLEEANEKIAQLLEIISLQDKQIGTVHGEVTE